MQSTPYSLILILHSPREGYLAPVCLDSREVLESGYLVLEMRPQVYR